jgi:hypothetical protein
MFGKNSKPCEKVPLPNQIAFDLRELIPNSL